MGASQTVFVSQRVLNFVAAMRHSFLYPLLFLGSLTLPCLASNNGNAPPPGSEAIKDPEQAKKLAAYWKDYTCFIFSDQSEPKLADQCKEACFPGGVTSDVPAGQFVKSSLTCWLNGEEVNFVSGKPLTEEEKKLKKQNPKSGEYSLNRFVAL